MADTYPLTPEQRAELERRGWLFWTQEEGPHAGAPIVVKHSGGTHDAQVMWEGDHWYFWGGQAAVLEFAAVAGLSVPGYVMLPVRVRPNTTKPGYVAQLSFGGVAYTGEGDTPEEAKALLAAALKSHSGAPRGAQKGEC